MLIGSKGYQMVPCSRPLDRLMVGCPRKSAFFHLTLYASSVAPHYFLLFSLSLSLSPLPLQIFLQSSIFHRQTQTQTRQLFEAKNSLHHHIFLIYNLL